MTIVTSKTFETEDGQAVLLPSEVAYDDDVELTIVRSGDTLTVYPTRPAVTRLSMKELAERLAALPAPGEIEVRDTEDLPERPGF